MDLVGVLAQASPCGSYDQVWLWDGVPGIGKMITWPGDYPATPHDVPLCSAY